MALFHEVPGRFYIFNYPVLVTRPEEPPARGTLLGVDRVYTGNIVCPRREPMLVARPRLWSLCYSVVPCEKPCS